MCHCDNEVIDNLNKVLVFNPSYDDFSNSVLHNNEINVSNIGDIVPNLILNPLVTNVQFPKFTVTKHCFSNKAILYKGTTIGSVTSPLCKVIDADSPMRLNGSLLCPDIDLNNSSINLNEKSVTLNFTINNNVHCSEIMNSTFIDGKELSKVDSTLQSVSNIMELYDAGLIDDLFKEERSNYDLMPPSELDRGAEFEDDDLKDEWTREELVEKLIIRTEDPVWKKKFEDLLYKYREVFSKGEYAKGCKLPEMKLELVDMTPVYIPQFRVNPSLDKELEALMNEMIEGGIVKKSNSPWNFPAMFIRKRAGPTTTDEAGNIIKPKAKLRFLLDLRVCNSRAKLFHFPLPSVSGLLEQTAGFKIFSGGDLCNGFFQAPIDEASSRIMSWTTGTGRYSLKSLPQGFVNSPMLFSAAITQAFGEVLSPMSLPITTTVNGKTTTEMVCKQRVHLYIDDIFSEAEDLATMFTITEMILEKMVKFGLKYKITKCEFACKEAKFLGHIISAEGIRKDPAFVEKVLEMPRPYKGADLLRFLGAINWIFLLGGGPQITYLPTKNEDLEQQTGQNQPGVGSIQLRNQVDPWRE
ncbi:unnamed protein product [Rotaria magnacalcarata]|uniref:Reverse transcriptase domain-containing protein n=1 Tax=Rotaria magnacalcarata TaxID=392030 RepID=A0A816ZLT1_9BILA|nr:unnamed protein product [Rotaria magnacalcarata]